MCAPLAEDILGRCGRVEGAAAVCDGVAAGGFVDGHAPLQHGRGVTEVALCLHQELQLTCDAKHIQVSHIPSEFQDKVPDKKLQHTAKGGRWWHAHQRCFCRGGGQRGTLRRAAQRRWHWRH